jgi:NADH-quinone oxidoreductase subunit L
MVTRCSVLFALAPVSMTVVAIIGGATALYAATIGITQFDIKRVLAYSTISQLGYMFMACGVGAFGSGIFHLMTHAFFKALLFMAAGSVMHAMSGELDMRKMGALKSKVPITCGTYLVGTLAITGIPFLAGFFSKDEILFFAFERHIGFWILGAVAAIMTSFYMFRSVFMTFYGKSRVEPDVAHHVHESPPIMTLPLVILAVLSCIGGFVGVPIFEGFNRFGEFLAPVLAPAKAIIDHGHHAAHHSIYLEVGLMLVSVLIAVVGLLLAYRMYITDPDAPDRVIAWYPQLHSLVYNKYKIDELYDFLFVNSIVKLSRWLWKAFDDSVIDGIVNGTASLTRGLGSVLRRLESGLVKDYALSILVGTLVVIGYLVLR